MWSGIKFQITQYFVKKVRIQPNGRLNNVIVIFGESKHFQKYFFDKIIIFEEENFNTSGS